MRRFLVTGGAGFIGSNFVRFLFENEPDAEVTNLDLLTYAGIPATVDELDQDPRHTFVKGDIRDVELVDELMPGHDVVVHFAAESHVDRMWPLILRWDRESSLPVVWVVLLRLGHEVGPITETLRWAWTDQPYTAAHDPGRSRRA